jgi:O-antigen ligase
MRKINVIDISFLLLNVIIFLNLNGITSLFFNLTAFFSPLILFLCASIILGSIKNFNPNNTYANLIFKFYLFFLVYGVLISVLTNFNWSDYTKGAKQILTTMLIFTSYYSYLNNENNRFSSNDSLIYIVFYLLIISVLSIPVFAYFNLYTIGSYSAGESRNSGVFANPNEAGVAANYLMVFTLYHFSKTENDRLLQNIFILVFLLSIYSTLLTFSRTSMLSVFVIVILFYFIFLFNLNLKRYKLKSKLLTFSVVIISILAVSIFSFSGFVDNLNDDQNLRIESMFQLGEGQINEETTGSRSILLANAMFLIFENPVFGYGLDSFHSIPPIDLGCHNNFAMVWGEVGIFGLLLFLYIYIYLGAGILKIIKSNLKFLLSGLLFVSIFYMSTNHDFTQDKISNIILLVIAIIVFKEKSKQLI